MIFSIARNGAHVPNVDNDSRYDTVNVARLSRFSEAPLLLIADEVKANLIGQGWFETPNATEEK